MSNRLPLPVDLQHLIEKRDPDLPDRRDSSNPHGCTDASQEGSEESTCEPGTVAPETQRCEAGDRRRKKRRKNEDS